MQTPPKSTAQAYNQALVDLLKGRGELNDPRIEAAFLAVPRHLFVPSMPLERAYSDDAIAIKFDIDGTVLSSLSQPDMISSMLHQLRLKAGDNVLEIGTGTGYTAALMQTIVGESGKVTTVEYDNDMVNLAYDHLQRVGMGSKITVVKGDGAAGYSPRAAYDRIIATVGIWDVPVAWEQQLKTNGVLVAPIWLDSIQASAAFRPQADGSLYSADNQPCGFVHLRGSAAGPRLTQRVGGTSLMLFFSALTHIDMAALNALLSDDADVGYTDNGVSAQNYWNGFLPYLMLNVPTGYVLAIYTLIDDVAAYGIDEPGFALIGKGSACFLPYSGQGKAYCFAGADAFLAVDDSLKAWIAAGRGDSRRLRLQLTPIQQARPAAVNGRIYARRDHNLHVWFDDSGGSA